MHFHRPVKAFILLLALALLAVWVAPPSPSQPVAAQDDPTATIEALAEAVHIQNFRSGRSTNWIGGDLGVQGLDSSGVPVGWQYENWRVEDIYDENTEYTLSDLDKPILVNIWASWCGPCVFEFPFLTEYAQQEDLNFNLWFVNAADTTKSAAIRFLNGQDPNINALYDAGDRFSNGLGNRVLPTTVLIDTDGTVIAAHGGIVTDSVMDFFNAVAAAPRAGSFDGSNYDVDLVELLQPIDAANATEAPLGQQAPGVIDDDNFRRDYTFSGEANDNIQVRVTYTSGDVELYAVLVSPSGELVVQNEESEASVSGFTLTYTLPEDGDYVLVVSRFLEDEGFGEGSFNILVSDPDDGATTTGPNDTLVLTTDSSSSGVLTFERQQELYVLDVAAGQTLTFTLTHDLPDETLNLQVRQGATRLVRYTTTENGELTVEATAEEGGTYSVFVARSSSSRAGPITYTLTVSETGGAGPEQTGGTDPVQIEYGQTVEGVITNQEFEQRFEFVGGAGDVVNVTAIANPDEGNLDTTLTLLAPDGELLAENDDVEVATTDSALTDVTLPAEGTYTIVVSRFLGEVGFTSGPYTLTLDGTPAPETDAPDDTDTTTDVATELSYGDTITGEITNENFAQTFTFEAQAGDIVTIEAARADDNSTLDTLLILNDPDGEQVARNDDFGGTLNSTIETVTLQQTGTYTIVMTRFLEAEGISTGEFTLTLTLAEFDGSVPDDTDTPTTDATPLAIGDFVTGTIDAQTTEQRYTFEGTAGEVITLRTSATSGNLDTTLTLLGPDGEEIASNDDASFTTRDSLLDRIELTADGEYTVIVGRFGDSTGTFDMVFSAAQEGSPDDDTTTPPDTDTDADAAPPVLEDATPISYGATAEGFIDNETVSQAFTFEGNAGDVITLLAFATSGDLDTTLELRTPDGEPFAANDDAEFGSLNSAILDLELPATGTYIVVVSRFQGEDGSTSGDFILTLTAAGVTPPDPEPGAVAATPLSYSETVTGTINAETFEVLYSFVGNNDDVVTIEMRNLDGTFAPALFLLNERGEIVARPGAPGGIGSDAAISEFELSGSGTYTIRATRLRGENGTGSGDFELTLTLVEAGTPGSDVGDPATTGDSVLSYGDTVTGEITNENFAQTFTFEAQAGDVVTIEAARAEDGTLDTLLILEDPDGEVVARNDDFGGTLNSTIEAVTLEQAGTYTITMTRFLEESGASTGEFTLTLTLIEGSDVDTTPSDTDNVDTGDSPILAADETVTGTITNEDFEQRFSFNADAGDVVTIELRADNSELDPLLQVLTPDGTVLAENDDEDFISTDSLIEALELPADGTYTVVATRFNGESGLSTGDYVLLLTFGSAPPEDTDTPDVDEPTDPNEVRAINFGETVQGELTNANFADEYTFETEAGDTVSIELRATSGDLDTLLELYNPTGELIASNDDVDLFSDNLNSALNNILLGGGTHTIVATRFDGAEGETTGTYELTLTRNSATDFTDATPLSYGDSAAGTITDDNVEDIYTFTGTAGDTVTIEMTATDTLDTLLLLLGPDNQEVAFSDDFDPEISFDAAIVDFVLPVDGTYTIIATRYDAGDFSTEGDYTLSLTVEGAAPPNDTDTTPPDDTDTDTTPAPTTDGQVLSADMPVQGTINAENLDDRYVFTGEAGEIVTISMVATGGGLDPYLSLLNAEGVEIAFNDDNIKAIGNDALILQFKLPADGTYTVVATRYGAFYGQSAGDYELTLVRN